MMSEVDKFLKKSDGELGRAGRAVLQVLHDCTTLRLLDYQTIRLSDYQTEIYKNFISSY